MNRFYLLILFLGKVLIAQNYHQYVNPFIGTGGHGHTYPGASLPFGMVQLSPDTRIDGSWDGCSGYHYSDNVIYGFSHTHLSGTGVSDYGDIMLMPTMGLNTLNPKDYSSEFSHEKEKASAGYYSVYLNKHDVSVELTTSTRVGFHKYKFHKSGKASIILDLNHRDKLLDGEIRIVNDKTLEIYRKSDAWATHQQIWARIEFNKPIVGKDYQLLKRENTQKRGLMDEGLILPMTVQKGEELLIKVAVSFTGFEGAKLNSSEIPHWDFEKVKAEAARAWDRELSKIEIKSDDKNKLTIFYTALYHTMLQPNIAQDLDGKYMGRDFKVHTAKDFDYYTVFSLWDTFRAAHPLYTLIDQKRTSDFINTFLKQYEQGGRLPVWELASNETDCMIGYHSVSVMADAMVKGIKGFDYEKAFEAAKHSAMLNHLGLEAYKDKGFISIEDEHESVSKTLEYAYDDWCIAQMALLLGKEKDYEYFMERSQYWKNLFDPETKLMRPKKNGAWLNPFDGREVNNNYTEANSWQYSFFVPQDISGLIAMHGGNEKFEQKLDEIFSLPSAITGRQQADITGLIGQYAHGNEPSHHVAYLYNYIGKPEKTKEKVHFILDEFYKNTPDGLIGNEDCGQMSAWYVLSAMGIYSVSPGSIKWAMTEPYFDEIKINYEDGSTELIRKSEYQPQGFVNFRNQQDRFQTLPKVESLIAVPYFGMVSKSFQNSQLIEIKGFNPEEQLFYSFDGINFKKYIQAFEIKESTKIYSYAVNGNHKSKLVSAEFMKRPNEYSIKVLTNVHPMYTADLEEALIDGIYGTTNWRKGEWQGYQGTDFEAIIDLKSIKEISKVSVNFLQDARSWILMPQKLKVFVSTDGNDFQFVGEEKTKVSPEDERLQIEKMEVKFPKRKFRYVKVVAENYGKLPTSHISAGEEAYIFIDEIELR